MAASGFTPIQLYHSTTAAAAPTAGNLNSGELAININDGKLFYKDSGGTVQTIATKDAAAGNFTTVDTTNLEVTNIKAKDGTAAASIADSTGAVTVSSAFAANGGVTIGDASGDAFTINSSAVSTPNGLNFDSNTFVIDATNNRVGINNASPTVELDVTGALTISGNAILGDASTDTVRVNGYMGVGGAANSAYGLNVTSSALTGTGQWGIRSVPVATSASTTFVVGVGGTAGTAAASFTVGDVYNIYAGNSSKGAGSTITNQHGLYIADQTQGTNNFGITSAVSSGTDKWNIYASGTAQNYFAGRIGIGVTAPGGLLDASGSVYSRFLNTTAPTLDNDTHAGEALYLRSGGTAGAENVQAVLAFGKADSSSQRSGAAIASIQTTADADQIGLAFYISSSTNSSQTMGERFRIGTTEAVFNDVSANYNFRVESDTNTHAIFLDAANSRVGINNASPTVALDVTGALTISGNAILGDATTDTVTVNGYMAVGGAVSTNRGLSVINSALSGVVQSGIVSNFTATSAATTQIFGVVSEPNTAAAAFTAAEVTGVLAANVGKGAGSTITNQYGVRVADQTQGTNNFGVTSQVSSGTNKWNIYASGTAQNYFAGNVLIGTTTNTNSSKLVVDGTISETVSSVQYLVASQADIGTAPNEIPLNQYLGALAYKDTETPALDVGTGISTGTGTICKANGGQMGGIYRMTILIDLTGLNSGGTAGDIIGVNGTALPCYIAQLPAMTVLGGRMTCLETPAGGDTDIDLYSATEGTGVEDQAITALTETQIINAGAQTVGTVTYFSADPAANAYFYLVGQGTANATYTAGRFLIEIFGVQ